MKELYLAFDTSTEACSVALFHQDQCIVRQSDQMNQTHTQYILPWIQECLDEAGASVTDLRGLVCTLGPGSFTGVRLGVSIAQALAFAHSLPVLGVSTLQLLAMQAPKTVSKVIPMLDARMGQIYWGYFERDERGLMLLKGPLNVTAPQALSLEFEKKELFLLGSGVDSYLEYWTRNPYWQYQVGIKPQSQYLFPLLKQAFLEKNMRSANTLEPLYVRNQVA